MWLTKPSNFSDLDLLRWCAGYEVREEDGRWVVLTQEHRMVIPAIWASRTKGLWTRPPLLVHIDAHTDYEEEGRDYSGDRNRIHTLEDCLLYANSLAVNDDAWVEAVVKLGWVEDAVCLYVQPNETTLVEDPVEDIDGALHRISAYDEELDPALHPLQEPDGTEYAPLERLAQILGLIALPSVDPEPSWPPIWLDIDLDFAKPNVANPDSRPLSACGLRKRFSRPVARSGPLSSVTAWTLMDALLTQAKLTTIVTEPAYAGGYRGVAITLNGLRKVFPNHRRVFQWWSR